MDNPITVESTSEYEAIVEKKIAFWMERLQDLSGRNRLLNFKPFRSSTLEIIHPDLEVLFNQIVGKNARLKIPVFELRDNDETNGDMDDNDSVDDSSNEEHIQIGPFEIGVKQPNNRINRILYNLRSRARTALEEQGVHILYLAIGFVRWYEVEKSRSAKAPIILVPISIERESAANPYYVRMVEEDIVLNPSFVVKLRNDFNIEFPELPEFDSYEDVEIYFQQIRETIDGLGQWSVIEEAAINIFNFQNLVIIGDIDSNRDIFSKDRLIQALSLGKFEKKDSLEVEDFIEANELDMKVKAADTYQVLFADSSQQETIEAAKSGADIIIQGPPGTGKSQTIANLIAEFLAQNKKILFVSQKAAALEVVKRRLEEVGLDEFCLMVHSHKRNKLDVIQELGTTLDSHEAYLSNFDPTLLTELEATKRYLNQYINALHKPTLGLGITPYQLYGYIAKLEHVETIRFSFPNIERITQTEFKEAISLLASFTIHDKLLINHEDQLWYGIELEKLSLESSERIEDSYHELQEKITILDGYIDELASIYNLETPITLLGFVQVLRVARVFHPDILNEAEIVEISNRFNQRFSRALRYLIPQYWKDRKAIKCYSKEEKLPGYNAIKSDLEYVVQLLKLRKDTDYAWEDDEKQSILSKLSEFSDLAKSITQSFQQLAIDLGNPSVGQIYLFDYPKIQVEQLFLALKQRRDQIGALEQWVRLHNLIDEANNHGLDGFLSTVIQKNISVEKWVDIFKKRFYTLALDRVVGNNKVLMNFEGKEHEGAIQKFQNLDQNRIHYAKEQIINRIRANRPDASWMKTASPETSILRREMNKKRRIKPLRTLFREIPDLLLSLKPCLMMSPYTVSQLMHPNLYRFDVVLFDEASQMPSEYAVAGLVRGEQVIIAGDTKQLPPTRFFQTMEIDSEQEDDIYDEFESILNEADAIGFPSKSLKWHYRSRDEALIAFSNYQFYRNQLLTFPNSNLSSDMFGIQFHHVADGVYRRGAGKRDNVIEAREVVNGVLEHFENNPDKSLGVVTFNQSQKQTIDAVLDQALSDNPHLQKYFTTDAIYPFFVKNLESVQGDERDFIFFSVGFGKDEAGKFIMNFGPLNKAGGERRLNVAVTRARYGVRVYSSIQPEDIDLSRTKSQGAKLLRSYLEVARDGPKAAYRDLNLDRSGELESPFEIAVYNALTEAGLDVRSQIGVSGYRIDLAIVDDQQPGKYLLGIECDGAMYHSAATARDRDQLRQFVLEGLGWKIHRIWSRDWFRNSRAEVGKVLQKIEKIKQNQGQMEVESHKEIHPTPQNDFSVQKQTNSTVNHSSKPKETSPYIKAKIQRLGQGAGDFWSRSHYYNKEAILSIVSQEGPIAISMVEERMAEAWGIGRMSQKIKNKISDDISQLVRSGKIQLKDNFLFAIDQGEIQIRISSQDGYRRSIEEIPLEELAEAVYLCVKTALSITPDDLLKETARIFDFRLTDKARERLIEAAQLVQRSGRIKWREDKVRLPQTK